MYKEILPVKQQDYNVLHYQHMQRRGLFIWRLYRHGKWNHKRKYATPQEVNLSTSFLLYFTCSPTVSD